MSKYEKHKGGVINDDKGYFVELKGLSFSEKTIKEEAENCLNQSTAELKTLLEEAFDAGFQLHNDIEMNNESTYFVDWYKNKFNE